MLVICEDCAKKYNIDESRIHGTRARFICKECGHIIIVDKPDTSGSPVSPAGPLPGGSTIDLFKEMQGEPSPQVHEEKPGPSAAAAAPRQTREERKPPPEQKQEQTPEQKQKPAAREQTVTAGEKEKDGGLPVSMHFIFALLYTVISTIGVMGYLYLGSFAQVLNRQPVLRADVLGTSLLLVSVVAVVGIVIFFFLSRLIAKPLGELTAAANRINDGKLDLPVVSRGPREVRELAAAFERVRLSCRK